MSVSPDIFDTKKWLRLIIKHPFHAVIPIVAITLFFALQLPNLRFQSSIYELTVEDLPESKIYQGFKDEFGTEEFILVVAKASNIFTNDTFERIGVLAEKFSKINGVRSVISLPGIWKAMDLTKKWDLAHFEQIIEPVELFEKNLISSDKKTTALTLILNDVKRKDLVIDAVARIIEQEKKDLSLYQIGMPLVAKALSDYTEKDFLNLPPLTFLLMALILFYFFRNFSSVLIPIGSVLMAIVWTLGFMGLTNTPLSMLTMIVPIFITAVGTAYCMYILSEFYDSVRIVKSSKEAAYQCFKRVGFPTVLAVITTSIGLASLFLNKIHAIKEFAIFSCVGIFSMLIIMLIFFPAVLGMIPIPKNKFGRLTLGGNLFEAILAKVIQINLHHQKAIFVTIGLLVLIGVVGIFRIKVETNPTGYFKEDTPISQNFHDIHQNMAGSFPVNVVVDSKEEDYFENPEPIGKIGELKHFLESLDGVDKSISFADYFKLVNYAENKYKKESYSLPQESFEVRMLMNSFKTILGQDMFEQFMNMDLSKTNILLRTHISSSADFLLLKRKITDHFRKIFPEEFEIQVTGFGVVISHSSQVLTKGQIKSLSVTLALIFFVMLLLFLSGKAALIAIIPNCFPIIINFGFIGWAGIPLSVSTSLIACIAIGLAVDDAIHYLVRYNSEFKKDLNKDRALQDTIKSVGRAIIFTTFAISIGFSILLFSHFKPTSVFGLMMIITMFSALVGDLIILPSLLLHVELVTARDLLKILPTHVGISQGMAHEINQPLNTIKMGSEYLKMMIQKSANIPKDQLSQVVHEISDQVDRASQIINRLRSLDHKPDFTKDKIDINQPIINVLSIIAHEIRLENIELNVNLDHTGLFVFAQKNRLEQLFFNLITNAREAINKKGESGPVSGSSIITVNSFLENNMVAVTVTDTGIGISRSARGRIFEPFFTTQERDKGKGLGLSISHQIVKDFGGDIEVLSEKGSGSTFKVTFPLWRPATKFT